MIRGTIRDAEDRPVAAAQVVLRETATNFERSLTSQPDGRFLAAFLPLGTYYITARAIGHGEGAVSGIGLRVGETVDVTVRVGAVRLPPILADARTSGAGFAEGVTRFPTALASRIPNNGRNYLSLALLAPHVATVQGPDGDELSVGGQRGIHNNVTVDGADFNSPFYGEHRGGQRPPFTFNLDAVREIVVVTDGANAEFGRSSGGFVNVITKSGTNRLTGSAHYFGKHDALAGDPRHGAASFQPDFAQHQFGLTLGGPIVRDRAFFFAAYDQQAFDETKQRLRPASPALDSLRAWADTAFDGALRDDFGPIARTNDARAGLLKLDVRLGERHNLSLKYNHSWSLQRNGTFDVDTWTRSANALERDFSNAVNGALVSYLSPRVANELRVQYSREDRPRDYEGPVSDRLIRADPADRRPRPFPDTGMDFDQGFRLGMPFFVPVEYYDTRVQILDNLSIASGSHLIKAGAEWNRTEAVQTFVGFANGRFIFSSVTGFLNYVQNGSGYVECSDGSSSVTATCPAGTDITGPVLLYLQQAGVPPLSVEEAGTQSIPQHELAAYIQDTWRPAPGLTLHYGLRWEAQIQPGPQTQPSQVFYAPFLENPAFPSDGTVPSDWTLFQPRAGMVFDPGETGAQRFRASAGVYHARVPGLTVAGALNTNGSLAQTLFGSSASIPDGLAPPAYDSLLVPGATVFFPDIYVFDRNFRNPRTVRATVGYERRVAAGLEMGLSYTHARSDRLTRFVNRNDPVFGDGTSGPWSSGLEPGGTNGINTLIVTESSAHSTYNGVTASLRRASSGIQFEANYTLSFDRSDDDNERDPFTFRYARADNLAPEWGWSDRDQRHRVNAWVLGTLPGHLRMSHRVSWSSAQPVSERCGPGNTGSGERAATPADRICADGSILRRNTLRKDNAFFSWDVRLSRDFNLGGEGRLEAIVEVFNVTNADNYRDPASASLLFNFDGTIRSGLGEARQAQVGMRWMF